MQPNGWHQPRADQHHSTATVVGRTSNIENHSDSARRLDAVLRGCDLELCGSCSAHVQNAAIEAL